MKPRFRYSLFNSEQKLDKYAMSKFDSFNSFKALRQPRTKKSKLIFINNLQYNKKDSSSNNLNDKNKDDLTDISKRSLRLSNDFNYENNKIMMRKLSNITPFKEFEIYARNKIKAEYITPFIEKLIKPSKNTYKIIRDEEKPIYYHLYKINDIFFNKRCRLNINFLDINIYLSDKEYLIKFFGKAEFRIIMRYLLGFIFYKDINCINNDIKKYGHHKKIVYHEFISYINNEYDIKKNKNPQDTMEEKYNNNYKDKNHTSTFFPFEKNLLKLADNAELNKRTYLFLKSPNYFLIKDMPNELVPNSIPNYFFGGDIMNQLLKKYSFFRKFKLIKELIKNDKKENIVNFLDKSKTLDLKNNFTDNSNMAEEEDMFYINFNRLGYKHAYNNEINALEKLIKNFEDEERFDIVPPSLNEIIYETIDKSKMNTTKRKKKLLKQPYENYKIIQCDNFTIKKKEKLSILNLINNTAFNLNSFQRNRKRFTTRLFLRTNNNNTKSLDNEKFIRKNKVFLTLTPSNNLKHFINDNLMLKKRRHSRKKSFRENSYKKEFNSININVGKNLKVFKNLVKQKKIRFTIKSQINIIKFKDTSEFITTIDDSIRKQNNTKSFIKDIITNYQKFSNEKKITDINFPEIKKVNKNISMIKRAKKGINIENIFLIKKHSIFNNNLNINDVFTHKKINL